MDMVKKLLLVVVVGLVVGNSSVFAAGKYIAEKKDSRPENPLVCEESKRVARRVACGLPAYIEVADLPAGTDDDLAGFGLRNFDLELRSDGQVFQEPVTQTSDEPGFHEPVTPTKTHTVTRTKARTVAPKPWYRNFCQVFFTWMSSHS